MIQYRRSLKEKRRPIDSSEQDFGRDGDICRKTSTSLNSFKSNFLTRCGTFILTGVALEKHNFCLVLVATAIFPLGTEWGVLEDLERHEVLQEFARAPAGWIHGVQPHQDTIIIADICKLSRFLTVSPSRQFFCFHRKTVTGCLSQSNSGSCVLSLIVWCCACTVTKEAVRRKQDT